MRVEPGADSDTIGAERLGGSAMAAVDYFIKFDGIKGESADAKHKDEIDIESWSWGATQQADSGTGSGRGTGKVSMQDFHFVMTLNRASPGLLKACATGNHIKEATLSARRAGKGQQDYLTFKFHDVIISSFQTGGSESASTSPMEQVAFNFSKLEMEYKPQKVDGSLGAPVHFKYDLKASKTF
jgi:type VI secretion system secreted protein Hcp